MQRAGYRTSFVGTRVDYGTTNHDGWPGYQMVNATAPAGNDQDSMAPGGTVTTTADRQIYGTVITNAMATDPNVVLLMIGVNDLFYPDYLRADQRGREFALVLDQIIALQPAATVIVAPITYRRGAVDPGQCDGVSAASQAVVAERAAAGKHVRWAPNAGGGPGGSFTQSEFDLPDSVHPATADAYGRMANGFYNAITEATIGASASAPTVAFATPGGRAGARWPGTIPLEVAVSGLGTLTYRWSQVAGPGTASFAPADAPRTTITFSRGGAYQVRLTVSNEQGLRVTKDVAVEMQEYPIGLVAEPGSGTLTLSWQPIAAPADPSVVVSYRVNYGTQAGGPYPTTIDNAVSPLVISGLTAGTTYHLVVTPVYALRERRWDGAISDPIAGTVAGGGGNQPPTCSLTSPVGPFTAPATVNLTASASDGDGTVAKVEFFNGTTKLGEDSSAPYSFSWTSVPASTYTLTVKATDNAGATTTSSAVSVTVSAATVAPAITAQPANQSVAVGATATFTVAASGNPAPTFQWQKNSANISGATSASYTTPATVNGDNGATYRCVVTNSAGVATSNAATLTVTVVADTTPPAKPSTPAVTGNGGAAPTLSGNAEAGATITLLEGGTVVATTVATGGTWTLVPTLTAGSHTLHVTATDAAGNVSIASDPVTVTVAGAGGAGTGSASTSDSSGKCGLGSGIAAVLLPLGLMLTALIRRWRLEDSAAGIPGKIVHSPS